jgi:valyl-tRNA synthetase
METGYDIIFFWVARMVLMTTYAIGEVPFETVYLHGMIRDRNGKKMSKSNPEGTIDPLDVIEKYGTDALRMSMIVGQSPGNDQKLYEEKIAGYRNFVNKLWNASRFVLMQCEEARVDPHSVVSCQLSVGSLSLADRAVLSSLQDLIDDVSGGLDKYSLSETGELLYAFTWDYFCDWYLELSKEKANPAVLVHVLRTIVTLLHPYCPFVTEELWEQIKPADSGMLISQPWPESNSSLKDQSSQDGLQITIDVISAIRSLRADQEIEPAKKVSIIIHSQHADLLESQKSHIERLGRTEQLTIDNSAVKHDDVASEFLNTAEVHMSLEGLIDKDKEIEKLSKDRDQLEGFIKGINAKLDNKKFVENAKEEVVDLERKKLESAESKLQKVEERLKSLS